MRNDLSIVVFGAGGHMGLPYVNALIQIGISTDCIVGIEPNTERRKAVGALGVRAVDSIERLSGLGFKPDMAIVAVPSPLHRNMFEQCARFGIKNIFTEKPLVLNASELVGLDELGLSIYTGYLIHFSPVADKLIEFMTERQLRCRQILSLWGKNWCAVDRPMGPDLEEELIHPLVTGLRIIGYKTVAEIKPKITGTFVPYVRPEIWRRGADEQFGYAARLNDTSLGNFEVQVSDGSSASLSIMSSFNLFEQRRVIDVTLTEMGSTFPDFKACLEFDMRDEKGMFDRVRIIDARSDEIIFSSVEYGVNKLKIQLQAALRTFTGETPDPRLVGIGWASHIVEVLDGALDD